MRDVNLRKTAACFTSSNTCNVKEKIYTSILYYKREFIIKPYEFQNNDRFFRPYCFLVIKKILSISRICTRVCGNRFRCINLYWHHKYGQNFSPSFWFWCNASLSLLFMLLPFCYLPQKCVAVGGTNSLVVWMDEVLWL